MELLLLKQSEHPLMNRAPTMTNRRRCRWLAPIPAFFPFDPALSNIQRGRSQSQHGFIQNISLSSSSADNQDSQNTQKPMSQTPAAHPAVFLLHELKILCPAIKTAPLNTSKNNNFGENRDGLTPKCQVWFHVSWATPFFLSKDNSLPLLPSDSVRLLQNLGNIRDIAVSCGS